MDKSITVPEELWNRLWDLKRKTKVRTLADVITEILNRDKQEVEKNK